MEIIYLLALLFFVFAAVKILVILIRPKSWMTIVRGIYQYPRLMMLVCLVLSFVVFTWLLGEISVLQIFAVMLFTALLAGISLAAYAKEITSLGEKIIKDRKMLNKFWLSILIWILLLILLGKELFF